MKDKEFLQWIHDRLVHVHGENEYVDYMHKLRATIAATDPEQLTPNTSSTCRSDITKDFTVTLDGNMTYHGDKPVNANMIFNYGDSLVRAESFQGEWDGEGLPPVGTVCELISSECSSFNFEDGVKVEVIAHIVIRSGKTAAVFKLDNPREEHLIIDYCAVRRAFRPIKSDKEKAIEEMLALDPDDGKPKMLSRSEFCGILYDARYRIQESGDE